MQNAFIDFSISLDICPFAFAKETILGFSIFNCSKISIYDFASLFEEITKPFSFEFIGCIFEE